MTPSASRGALLLFLLPLTTSAANMNGAPGQYKIANGKPSSSGVYYSTDYTAEYFEVYSPVIKTRYSEVHWRISDGIPLPDEIRDRFEGKVMAITGYEADQVRVDDENQEVPVPITWAYNHHYGAWLLNGRKVRLVKAKAGGDSMRRGLDHGSEYRWEPQLVRNDNVEDDDNDDDDEFQSEIPLMHFFSEGNGGESRMSYHGYPKGYAQLIESPDTFRVMPMQIDTWNREAKNSKFIPGPLPKSSMIPGSAGYNGLIECPCSDRIEKKWAMAYALQGSGSCTDAIQNATECFSSAGTLVQASATRGNSVTDPTKPNGCSMEQHADGTMDVWWNTAADSSPSGRWTSLDSVTSYSAFSSSQINITVTMVEEGTEKTDAVTITMVGPADRWFGVGFGSSTMCVHMQSDECPDGGPYAIVVSDDEHGGIAERRLQFHGPGSVLPSSVTVRSDVIANGFRTVVLTRPLAGATDGHYSFDPKAMAVPIITARGCGMEFAQHCGHGPSELTFLATDEPMLICRVGIEGTVGGNKFDNKRCAPFPYSDLASQHNPTCSVETYRGGLTCCRDAQSLLDKDQDIPWPDQYLEYRLKFRFYFEEYEAASVATGGTASPSHQDLVRLYWQTEAFAGEYDITPCFPGVPPEQCVQVLTSRWTVRDMVKDCSVRRDSSWCTGKGSADGNKIEGVRLLYAGPHCHAPHCLSMELYNADSGKLLCRVEPIRGEGDEARPYDELGFLSIPPCLWGDASEGLSEPELLTLDTTLLSVKRNNNTLGHTGEMASWQMRGVIVPKKKEKAERMQYPSTTLLGASSLADLDEIPSSSVERMGKPRNIGGV